MSPDALIRLRGWHTASAMMRLRVDHWVPPQASLGLPGIGELRWLLFVRPGDGLRVRGTVEEQRRSRGKPDRGLVRSLNEVLIARYRRAN